MSITTILIISFFLLFMLGSLSLLYAYGDFYKTINMRIADPTACVFEPEYDTEYFRDHTRGHVIKAILEWQDKLEFTTDGDWLIPTYYVTWEQHINKSPSDFLDCNILISFEKLNDNPKKPNSMGYTYYSHSQSWHKYAHIVIFTHTTFTDKIVINFGENDTTIKTEPNRVKLSDIEFIVKHEFGHALGLLHHYNTDISNEKRSVMHESFVPNINYTMPLQPRDINAIIALYGEDGYGIPNPPYIPKILEADDLYFPVKITDVRVIEQ